MPEVWKYEGYFFDLDGTIYLGDRLLPGVPESLEFLRSSGKKIMFLSNTTTRTRQECADRLRRLGLAAYEQEIITAGYASAAYLKELAPAPVVYAIGEPALLKELILAGVDCTGNPLAATHVLVGMDTRFDYHKLHQASRALRNGAQLIAANPDPNCPVENDLLPDTWPLVKAIEVAGSKAASIVIGKPSAYYAAKVLEWSGFPPESCLMVGDRLETDVRFGIVHGFGTALVLTGAASREELDQSGLHPDYVWSTLEELLSAMSASL
ncbi:MAG: haloacid dehalogenase [Paenibacillaceae bacterium]|nr:haloacid dehalogenase [Paenibacillaceae bacterium]